MSHDVHMGYFYHSRQFSSAELSALRLEGEVNQNADLWDVVHNWRSRSHAVLGQEKHPLVLTGLSAIWAFGLSREPLLHNASTVTRSRIRIPVNSRIHIEERTLTDQDYWLCSFVGVTSPLRTIIDILRMDNLSDDTVYGVVHSVMSEFSIEQSTIYRCLETMHSVPHKKRALMRASSLKF